MFCLRSYLVLLFLPINASPIFVLTFFLLTYLLNRPCVYCSLLLLILFASSCYWSDQCFLDLHGNWFEPRHLSSPLPNPLPHAGGSASPSSPNTTVTNATGVVGGGGGGELGMMLGAMNETVVALGKAAAEEVTRQVGGVGSDAGWASVRSWLGARMWKVPYLDVNVRL